MIDRFDHTKQSDSLKALCRISDKNKRLSNRNKIDTEAKHDQLAKSVS
jgi:hypothetical protein